MHMEAQICGWLPRPRFVDQLHLVGLHDGLLDIHEIHDSAKPSSTAPAIVFALVEEIDLGKN